MDAYRFAVILHLVAGTIALVSFWSAAIARKGSPLHIAIGRTYLAAMCVVLVTSAVLAGAFALRGQAAIATFLGYLVVITATACWLARQAVRTKRMPERYFGKGLRRLGWLNLGAGMVCLAIGVQLGMTLLLVFSWVGILGGLGMLRQARKPPRENPRWWLREHYMNVLGMGVATHIAFLSLGLRHLLAPLGLQPPQLLGWLLPVAVAGVAAVWLDRRYGASGRPQVAG